MAKVFVAYSVSEGFKAATTKVGLAKEIGVSGDTVRRRFREDGDLNGGWVRIGTWAVGTSDLVKVGGKRGKTGSGWFRGMKGKDGRLSAQADAEN